MLRAAAVGRVYVRPTVSCGPGSGVRDPGSGIRFVDAQDLLETDRDVLRTRMVTEQVTGLRADA